MSKQTVSQPETVEPQTAQPENPEQAKKKVSIFLQSKGGVGKSFLSYFKMLSSDPEKTAAVILDSSQKATQDADRHSKSLGRENVHVVNILNEVREYKKSHFFEIFQMIATLDRSYVILDIGAPESTVLREALESDEEMTGENLRLVADEWDLELIFNVVVSGADDNIDTNLDYYAAVANSLNEYFQVNMLINDLTFKADKQSDTLRSQFLSDGAVGESDIFVVGKSGSRTNDNAYLIIMAVANGKTTLEEANKNMSARIRLRNMLEPLARV